VRYLLVYDFAIMKEPDGTPLISVVTILVDAVKCRRSELLIYGLAYFETRTGLGLGPGLGLEENPDSRKTRTRTRKKSGLVFNKTRT
jgi:hypothetical protein